jgi:hypothetical protein
LLVDTDDTQKPHRPPPPLRFLLDSFRRSFLPHVLFPLAVTEIVLAPHGNGDPVAVRDVPSRHQTERDTLQKKGPRRIENGWSDPRKQSLSIHPRRTANRKAVRAPLNCKLRTQTRRLPLQDKHIDLKHPLLPETCRLQSKTASPEEPLPVGSWRTIVRTDSYTVIGHGCAGCNGDEIDKKTTGSAAICSIGFIPQHHS